MNFRPTLAYHSNPSVQESLFMLDDFLVNITPSVVSRVEKLQSNGIALENYLLSLITNKLDSLEGI